MKYIVPFYFRLEDYISDTQIILTIFSWPWTKLEFQRLVYMLMVIIPLYKFNSSNEII